ncbi:D-2-hydroxyacid dehydrogenase family protein [Kineococcus gynurae]|uniref:D-2-hydroxyacid dehydrogenase family protein n=1 Tax=Kineococcus gynurae TaxID=452979 RepID=A0ABV5LW95_9ACTN
MADRVRLLVLDDYQDAARRYGPWDRVAGTVDLDVERRHLEGEELVARLQGAAVVLAMRERTRFDAALFARLPDLRLLVSTGPVNAAVDLDAARAHGVIVSGTGITQHPTAELTWGLILGLARGLAAEEANVRAGGWQLGVGTDLAGRTLGVIGLGRLGRRVARVAQAFDMTVLAWSANLDADEARGLGCEPVGKEELLRRIDVVTIHQRLSDRTRGLIGAAELALMRPGAYLVNTSRGPIVDEAALVAALHEGRLGGAALDVFDVEPLPADSPLRATPNTLLSPHLGYVTGETYERFFSDAVADVEAWLAGAPVRVLG